MDAIADGRHARRQRNRLAVIEVVFELVQEGKGPPPVELVADRAGVSVSSIFRNFDGLADMQRQAIELGHQRFLTRTQVDPDQADAPLADRIRSHVRGRVELYEEAGALLQIGRARAIDHEPMVEGLALLRMHLADQTRQRFAVEVQALSPAAAADLVAIIDTITSPEAFELMAAAHARSSRQISRAWVASLTALVDPHDPTKDHA